MSENPFDTQLGYPGFVGRTDPPGAAGNCELGQLRGLVEAAKEGHGRLIVVEGEAGVGKTRLLRQLIAELRADRPLAGQEGEKFTKPPVPGILVSARDWKDRHEMVDALILELVRELEGTAAKISRELPEGAEHWSESFNKGIDFVLEKLGVPAGLAAGATGPVAVLVYGASYLGLKLLQGLLTRLSKADLRAPEAWPQALQTLKQVNEVFAKCRCPLVIAIDQWDDLAELELGARRDFTTILRGMLRTIEELNPCHILVLVGGRSGRINACTAGLPPLDKLPVNRLPVSEVRDLLLWPFGKGLERGPRFSRQAADAFLESCYGPDRLDRLQTRGNMAFVQLGAKIACDAAITAGVEVISLEEPPQCIRGSIEQVVEHQVVGFRSEKDDRAASEFLLALGAVEYSGFTADQVRSLMTEDQSGVAVDQWLREFSATTGLTNIEPKATVTIYSFSHHMHQIILREVVYGLTEESQRWWGIAQAAVSAIVVANPEGVPQSLSEIPGTAWVGPLKPFAMRILFHGEDADASRMLAAMRALGRIANNVMELDGDYYGSAFSVLIRGCRHQNSNIRQGAAKALGEIGDVRAVEPLMQALRDDIGDVREVAAKALCKIGEPAVEPLIEALRDESTGVRSWVVWSLGEIGDVRAVEPLNEALRDEIRQVRQAGAWALAQIGDVRAVEPLIQALQDEIGDVRQWAAKALGEIRDARAVGPLIQALRDEIGGVRWLVAWALGQIGDVRAVGPLIQALQDEIGEVRRWVAWALGEIGDVRAVGPLIEALRDEIRQVRQAGAEGLGKIGDVRAVEPLIQALQDDTGGVRRWVAWALGEIGDFRAVGPLIHALRDEVQEVHQVAAEGLKSLTRKDFGEDADAWQAWWDEQRSYHAGTLYESDECRTCRAEREQPKRLIEHRMRQHREEKEEKDGRIRETEEWLQGLNGEGP